MKNMSYVKVHWILKQCNTLYLWLALKASLTDSSPPLLTFYVELSLNLNHNLIMITYEYDTVDIEFIILYFINQCILWWKFIKSTPCNFVHLITKNIWINIFRGSKNTCRNRYKYYYIILYIGKDEQEVYWGRHQHRLMITIFFGIPNILS